VHELLPPVPLSLLLHPPFPNSARHQRPARTARPVRTLDPQTQLKPAPTAAAKRIHRAPTGTRPAGLGPQGALRSTCVYGSPSFRAAPRAVSGHAARACGAARRGACSLMGGVLSRSCARRRATANRRWSARTPSQRAAVAPPGLQPTPISPSPSAFHPHPTAFPSTPPSIPIHSPKSSVEHNSVMKTRHLQSTPISVTTKLCQTTDHM
jgi:hypothetical protein